MLNKPLDYSAFNKSHSIHSIIPDERKGQRHLTMKSLDFYCKTRERTKSSSTLQVKQPYLFPKKGCTISCVLQG